MRVTDYNIPTEENDGMLKIMATIFDGYDDIPINIEIPDNRAVFGYRSGEFVTLSGDVPENAHGCHEHAFKDTDVDNFLRANNLMEVVTTNEDMVYLHL